MKKVLALGLFTLLASSSLMSVSATEISRGVAEKHYNTAQFVPEDSSIEKVLRQGNVIEPRFGKDYIMASEVELDYQNCDDEAPYIEWWASGWGSILDKNTHEGRWHYTNACVVSRQSSGTIYAESGREYGYGKVPAESDTTHSNGEDRIFWGW